MNTAPGPDGPFNRAGAINAAAEGSWDIGIILDADVVAPAEQLEAAIRNVVETGRVTLGFTRYIGLTPLMTDQVLSGWVGDPSRGARYRTDEHESSIVVVPRAAWDIVGGFDERFQGWGQEDVAFIHAIRLLVGPIERVEGPVWHLWHARSPERSRTNERYKAAQRLGTRYRKCTTAEEMCALLASEEEDDVQPDVGSVQRVVAFARIYRSNSWNGKETRSGPGSGAEATAGLAAWLPTVCDELGIGSVLDAGCGEGMWQPNLPGYIGVDIVRGALAVARRRHPNRSYELADICRDHLPTTDAVLCRDALQHLPLSDAQAALANFRRSGAKYLIASSHQGEENHDVRAGGWYPCNLEAAPFWLGTPLMNTSDGWWAEQNRYPMKIMGVWAL